MGEIKVNFLAKARKFSIFTENNSGKVLIELFQKFAEHEAEPRTNAKASAFASMLQNSEALLLNFGQSQYFPNVGKYCALSPRAQAQTNRIIHQKQVFKRGDSN